jgi:hypothetical protein
MNIDARIVKRFLRPLFHPFQMLIRWNVKSAVKRTWKNRFLLFQAVYQVVPVEHRQEPFPVVPQSPASPEHDILGAGWLL